MKASNTIRVLAAVALTLMVLGSVGCSKKSSSTTAPVNHNPAVASVTVSSPSVAPGGSTGVTVVATDQDGDNLSYAYQVTGGAITGTGASVGWTLPTTPGAYSVTATVTDGRGGSAQGQGACTVAQPVTQVVGQAAFPVGTSGDLSNAKVSLYADLVSWANNQPVKYAGAVGSGAHVSFTITNVAPASQYYLDVWKDNDFNGAWSIGDYVGWYGVGGLGAPSLNPFSVSQGESYNCGTISMYLIVPGPALVKLGKPFQLQ